VLAVGVFVMPDGVANGALEDLCLQAVADATGEGELACIQDFLDCVASRGSVAWSPPNRVKAQLNAWLASRPDPTRRLGQAVAAGVLQPASPAFAPLRAFLTSLATAAGS